MDSAQSNYTVMYSFNPKLSSLMEGREVFIGCCACFRKIIFSLWSYLCSLIFLVKSIIYQSNDGRGGERKHETGGII